MYVCVHGRVIYSIWGKNTIVTGTFCPCGDPFTETVFGGLGSVRLKLELYFYSIVLNHKVTVTEHRVYYVHVKFNKGSPKCVCVCVWCVFVRAPVTVTA